MNIKGLFQKQKMMRTVLLALIPVVLMAVYLFGWRIVPLFVVVALAAVVSEYLVMRTVQKEKTRVSEAALVSAALFTLTLPPSTPFWIAVVGIVFGIVFGKAAFGGFGRNIFNPALVGRCFIYIAFPTQMTMAWGTPYASLPGGFGAWGVDAVTTATPIITYNSGGAMAPYSDLLFGFVGGSLGETSALLLILVGAYLVYKKVASWQIMVSTVAAGGLLSAILHFAGVAGAHGVALPSPLFTLLTGGFLFGAVLMATDPVSAPRDKTAQWITGSLIGIVTVIIRSFALFTEGMMFAILIVNALTPLIELQLKQRLAKGKKPVKEVAA